jgi:hypothetical protein
MASTINASTSAGLVNTADTSGILALQTAGTTAVTVDASQNVTFAGVTTLQAGTAALPALTKSGDTNTGIFFPAADVIAASTGGSERLRIDSGGNVSIGTTTNSTDPLYIKGSNASQLYTTLENSAAGDTGFHLKRSGGTTNDAYMYLPTGSTDLRFYNGGGDRITIQGSGNVGIGDTSPTTAKLVVTGSGTAASIMTSTVARFNGSANGINIGDDGTDGVIGVGNSGTNLGFLSRVAGVYTKTMVLTSAGYLLLGYTTSNGSYNLQVNSQIFATSATIATSDGRYKENVIPLSGALSLVNALNPVQFEWKKHPIHNFDRQQPTVGFIAQEVQQVLVDKPYLNSIIKRNECTIPEEKDANGNVTKEAYVEEFLGIAEGNMIAILTKAIQEQQALITQLQADVATLKGTT